MLHGDLKFDSWICHIMSDFLSQIINFIFWCKNFCFYNVKENWKLQFITSNIKKKSIESDTAYLKIEVLGFDFMFCVFDLCETIHILLYYILVTSCYKKKKDIFYIMFLFSFHIA